MSLGLARPIYGQAQNSGSISGRVTDGTGAVVAGAAIVLKSPTGGRQDSVSTNRKGEFVLNGVAPGSYNMTVTAKTFASVTFDNVMVDAGTDITLNATLRPASETADVTVDAPATTVDAQSATIATVIDQNWWKVSRWMGTT